MNLRQGLRVIKSLKTFVPRLLIIVPVFIISALGFSLFYSQPASAYSVDHSYTLYEKSGNYLYYNAQASTYEIINWTPKVYITKNPNSCGGTTGDVNIISSYDYTNCIGITIQAAGGTANKDWFEKARYSFVIGDFDHTETISVGGGRIHNWGASLDTVNASRQFATSHSGATAGACDSPNYKTTDDCSVLILFNPSYIGTFNITLDNVANHPSHEYVYDGPINGTYRTLTFNPNGGSVVNTPIDTGAIWAHYKSSDLLREYKKDASATKFPTPTKTGYNFLGWYYATTGGSSINSRVMGSDDTLYARWELIPVPVPMTGNTCRPILFTVEPWNNNSHIGSDSGTIPIGEVRSSIQNFTIGKYYGPPSFTTIISGGPKWYYSTQFDATSNHTTGDAYTISYKERGSRIDWHWHYGHQTHYIYYYYNPTTGFTTSSGSTYSYSNSTPVAWPWRPLLASDGAKNGLTGNAVAINDSTGKTPTTAGWVPTYSQSADSSWDQALWAAPGEKTKTIGPCYNYQLTSHMISAGAILEPGSSVSINPYVTSSAYVNTVSHTKSRPSEWRLTQLKFNPGNLITETLNNESSANDPAAHFSVGADSSTTIKSGTSVFNKNGTVISGPGLGYTLDIGDEPVGTKYCYVLSVRWVIGIDKTDGDSDWNHSSFSKGHNCIIIAKKPKTQIWGGDLISGNKVQTSFSVKAGSVFGSWVEYALFSGDRIIGMGSNSAFNGGLTPNTVCNYSKLTFTWGSNASGCLNTAHKGNYSISSIQDLAANFPDSSNPLPAGTLSPNIDLINSGTYMRSGNLELTQSDLSPGKSIILKVSGTVTISGNQTYNSNNNGSGYTQASQLPQLVIIANKIIINSNVTNVDAWLVANGSNGVVETCDAGPNYLLTGTLRLTADKCNEKLTVNGPVFAKELWLRRTAGSGAGASSGDPAEVFNLRADTFLWAASRSTATGIIKTVYTTELPPRF